nr:MAG TPA: hypothetical protein [Caudoviricetes sp.]
MSYRHISKVFYGTFISLLSCDILPVEGGD